MTDGITRKTLMRLALTLALGLVSVPALSHAGPALVKPVNLELLMKASAWALPRQAIQQQMMMDNLHGLFGVGGNITVSVGDDGVLLVDDLFSEMMPKIKAAINSVDGRSRRWALARR